MSRSKRSARVGRVVGVVRLLEQRKRTLVAQARSRELNAAERLQQLKAYAGEGRASRLAQSGTIHAPGPLLMDSDFQYTLTKAIQAADLDAERLAAMTGQLTGQWRRAEQQRVALERLEAKALVDEHGARERAEHAEVMTAALCAPRSESDD